MAARIVSGYYELAVQSTIPASLSHAITIRPCYTEKMKALMLLLIAIIFVATAMQLRTLYNRAAALSEEYARVAKKTESLEKENVDLQASIVYLSDTANLVKEARKALHYGAADERLIVVVPKKHQ